MFQNTISQKTTSSNEYNLKYVLNYSKLITISQKNGYLNLLFDCFILRSNHFRNIICALILKYDGYFLAPSPIFL